MRGSLCNRSRSRRGTCGRRDRTTRPGTADDGPGSACAASSRTHKPRASCVPPGWRVRGRETRGTRGTSASCRRSGTGWVATSIGRISFSFMLARGPRLRAFTACVLALAFVSSACRGNIFKREYEYEEEIYLDVDGSATVNVNSSIAALVALRGADLDTDPRARLDRAKIRQFFTGDAAQVTRVSGSRR